MRTLLALLLLLPALAFGADHSVTSGTSTVDCDTFGGGVNAGDTITLDGGVRADLTLRDCDGTSGNHITVRNDPTSGSRTTIRRTSGSNGGFVFHIDDSEFITIDGTGGWSGSSGYCGVDKGGTEGCGIRVESTNGSPSAFVQFRGTASDFTVKGVEINGDYPDTQSNGNGFQLNENLCREDYPGVWRENITFRENYIHDIWGEGIYSGPNYGPYGCSQGPLRLRDIIVEYNLAENTGAECYNQKSQWDGANAIRYNYCITSGIRAGNFAGNSDGIAIFEGGGDIYGNWIENAGESGIKCYVQNVPDGDLAGVTCNIYNNIIIDPGATGPQLGHGIVLGRATTAADGGAPSSVTANVDNNTVIGTEGDGINVNSNTDAGNIRNNIFCDTTQEGIDDNSGNLTATDNTTGACSSVGFVNLAGNELHLTSDANNATANYPDDDFDGVARPQGSGADRGAYEYTTGTPEPPTPEPVITTAKPSPCCDQNGSATYYPDHLYDLAEGSGTTLNDDGSGTAWNLTLTGGDWETPTGFSPAVSFVKANSDYAVNNTGVSLTGTVTVGAIIKNEGTFADGDSILILTDDESENHEVRLQFSSSGTLTGAFWDGAVHVNSTSFDVSDGEWHLVAMRFSDTDLDVCMDDNPYDTSTPSGYTGHVAALDSFSVAMNRDASPEFPGDVDVAAVFLEVGDFACADIFNSGDPWSELGIIFSGGEETPPARGTFQSTGGFVQ